MENHEVVIIDRYVPSNIAHQGAKLPLDDRDDIIRWIEQVEYDIYALPPARPGHPARPAR